MIAQHSYQSYFRLPFENTRDEKNSSDGLAEIINHMLGFLSKTLEMRRTAVMGLQKLSIIF
jgi:hypothetical protein